MCMDYSFLEKFSSPSDLATKSYVDGSFQSILLGEKSVSLSGSVKGTVDIKSFIPVSSDINGIIALKIIPNFTVSLGSGPIWRVSLKGQSVGSEPTIYNGSGNGNTVSIASQDYIRWYLGSIYGDNTSTYQVCIFGSANSAGLIFPYEPGGEAQLYVEQSITSNATGILSGSIKIQIWLLKMANH